MAFIFGGNTPWTYEELKRQRELANMLATDTSAPRNVGEGLNAIGNALAYRGLTKRANKEEARMKGEFDQKWGTVFGGGSAGIAPSAPSFGGAPRAPADPSSALGDDAMAALGKPKIRDYRESLIGTESGGNWAAQNSETGAGGKRGHFGRVQFGHARLQEAMNAGVIPQGTTPEQFMASPELQKAAEDWHFMDLEQQLGDLVGREVNGQPMDIGALVAMGHLGGAGGARRFVESGGAYNPADSFGTSLADYARTHGGTVSPFSGAPQGGMNLGALVELAGDPMATPAQKAIVEQLIAQQTTAADPMKALELEKAQLEIERLRNPDQQQPDALVERRALLQAAGIEETSPEGQNYLLTGKMPEAPEEAARPMTAEEKAAWGIPETDTTPYKMTDNGPVAIGGGGTTITNVMDGGGKFEEAFAKGDAATIETVYNSGLAAQRNLGRIDQLGALLEANPTGAGAAITQFAGSLGIQTEGLDEIQAAQALINSLVPEQRQPGSGPMSDADLALFKQSLPQIINSPGGNKIIVDTMRSIAQYDAEGAQIVQRLRNGELTRAEAFDALQNRKNPLAEFKPPSQAEAAPSGSGAPEGIEQEVWDAMTPEERALWD